MKKSPKGVLAWTRAGTKVYVRHIPEHRAWEVTGPRGRGFIQELHDRTDPYAQFGPCVFVPMPNTLRTDSTGLAELKDPWWFIPLRYPGGYAQMYPLADYSQNGTARIVSLDAAFRHAEPARGDPWNNVVVRKHLEIFPPQQFYIALAEGRVEHVCAGCSNQLLSLVKPCTPGISACFQRYRQARRERC